MKQEYQGYTGVWRRLKSGAAIFIRDGEDIRKAVKRNFEDTKNKERLRKIADEDDRAFEREQQARKERMKAFREKGELSDEYNKADMDIRSAKDEQDRLRNERYRVEDEAQKTRFKNEFGIKVNPAQVEQLKKIGQVQKNTADLENSIIAHKETRAKMNKVGMQNASYELTNKDLADEIAMNEFKNKYARFYGHEAMKEVEARTIADLDKKITGQAQTREFKTKMTPKQKATAIDSANNWREQIKKNNEETQKVTLELEKQRQNDYYRFRQDEWADKYYGAFRDNERRNAKIKKEIPEEKYEYVDSYATYKDKFDNYKDGETWTGKAYTNDEFMEHLTDANWHSERRMLEDAKLTNAQLTYIKDRVKLGKWSADLDKEKTERLINEAKASNGKLVSSLTPKQRARNIDKKNKK